MSERDKEHGERKNPRPAPATHSGLLCWWLIVPCFLLALWAGAAVERVAPDFKWALLPVAAAVLATAIFAMILNRLVLHPAQQAAASTQVNDHLKELLDVAGPAVVALDLDGGLVYCNSATARLTGYGVTEFLNLWGNEEVLAPGEGDRLLAEMQKLCRMDPKIPSSLAARIRELLVCVRQLPADVTPSFDLTLRHKSGEIVPIRLHISPLRNATGKPTGMVAVAVDKSAAQQQSRERLLDLVEHSSQMMAMLGPNGNDSLRESCVESFLWPGTGTADSAAIRRLIPGRRTAASGCTVSPRPRWREDRTGSAAPLDL